MMRRGHGWWQVKASDKQHVSSTCSYWIFLGVGMMWTAVRLAFIVLLSGRLDGDIDSSYYSVASPWWIGCGLQIFVLMWRMELIRQREKKEVHEGPSYADADDMTEAMADSGPQACRPRRP